MSGLYDEDASPWASQADDGLDVAFHAPQDEASPWGNASEPSSPIDETPATAYDPYSVGSAPLVADETRDAEEEQEEAKEEVSQPEPTPELKPRKRGGAKKNRGALKVEKVESDPLAASTVQLSDVSLSKPAPASAGVASADVADVPHAGASPADDGAPDERSSAADRVAQFGQLPQPALKPRVNAKFEISVGDPSTVGDMANAHTEYTVQLSTDCEAYGTNEAAVQRRYRDFRWLYRTLEHTHPGVVVPAVPDKQALGRFKDDFVQQRRAGLETMLRKMVAHPLLYEDPDLIAFLTSADFNEYLRTRLVDDEALQRATHTALNYDQDSSSTGSGFIGTLSGALSLSRGTDADPWTVQKRKWLDEVETHLRAISRDLVTVSINRQHISDSLGDLASVLKVLSEIEATQRLSSVLRSFSKVHDRIAAIYARQRQQNVLTLEATLDEHVRTVGSIRDAIAARQRVFSEAESASTEFDKCQAALDRFRRQGRVQDDRSRALEEDAGAAADRAQQLQQKARDVARLVEAEIARVNEEKIIELRNAVEIYLEISVEGQKEAIEVWETFYSRNFAS